MRLDSNTIEVSVLGSNPTHLYVPESFTFTLIRIIVFIKLKAGRYFLFRYHLGILISGSTLLKQVILAKVF